MGFFNYRVNHRVNYRVNCPVTVNSRGNRLWRFARGFFPSNPTGRTYLVRTLYKMGDMLSARSVSWELRIRTLSSFSLGEQNHFTASVCRLGNRTVRFGCALVSFKIAFGRRSSFSQSIGSKEKLFENFRFFVCGFFKFNSILNSKKKLKTLHSQSNQYKQTLYSRSAFAPTVLSKPNSGENRAKSSKI